MFILEAIAIMCAVGALIYVCKATREAKEVKTYWDEMTPAIKAYQAESDKRSVQRDKDLEAIKDNV